MFEKCYLSFLLGHLSVFLRYLDKDDNALDADNLTDDEYQEEYMNEFERKFNFRFEEPDQEFVSSYFRFWKFKLTEY